MTIKTIMMEKFAALEHERWAKWQKYFFSKCQIKPQSQVNGMDDRYVYLALPKDLYERWLRQIETPYSELSEQEKESDREQVSPYLEEFSTLLDEIEKEVSNIDTGFETSFNYQYRKMKEEVLSTLNKYR